MLVTLIFERRRKNSVITFTCPLVLIGRSTDLLNEVIGELDTYIIFIENSDEGESLMATPISNTRLYIFNAFYLYEKIFINVNSYI